ncbi:MAG TPA: hypothetical protein VEJ36_05915 [Nitrososphaerales archaeon]|nr:hypothetical protein [Nitrososphaerales archaeon]
MLSQSSRQEIVRRITLKVGHQFDERDLTPATNQAITNLATVQRHLYVIVELQRGEQSRIDRSLILRAASKLGDDSEKKERKSLTDEVNSLQAEIESKVSELATQVVDEEGAKKAGNPPPEYTGKLDLIELKCPKCGASMPIPTGRFVQCQYCKANLAIEDVSPQLRSMIQSI